MPAESALDDDYIISLLSSGNPQAHLRQKRDKHAPKPNTRFLKQIVSQVDSHNAALLAKENADSRARLRALVGAGQPTSSVESSRDSDRKRKREDGDQRAGRWGAALGGLGRRVDERATDRPNRSHESRPSVREDDSKRRKERHEDSDGRHVPCGAPECRAKRPSPKEFRPSRREGRVSKRRCDCDRAARFRVLSKTTETRLTYDDYDEDAADLDAGSESELPGPSPPSVARPRGRGAQKKSGGTMDLRFNDPTYDPSADVSLDEDVDDWDEAQEALGDRAKWRSNRAARLREAGFSETDVKKWEGSGREKDDRDVRWTGKGESREWDRGKVLDKKGRVCVKAEWTKAKKNEP
ncbi:hypothetical protein B0A48_11506 [Cryoendolithus antarcticus]|uniref:Uncharacterized protein n=1 Tax=Cryoendolithus antarcticus TaxID=1507870 RepID=A0A1V8SW14_9PEZI|nr:hypothetical protein B0A48_11506 [Cryoendolithus antarcticus]